MCLVSLGGPSKPTITVCAISLFYCVRGGGCGGLSGRETLSDTSGVENQQSVMALLLSHCAFFLFFPAGVGSDVPQRTCRWVHAILLCHWRQPQVPLGEWSHAAG